MYNVTLRRVRESSLHRKSTKCYQFFSVRVCVRAAALASGCVHVRAPYCDVICGPSGHTTFFVIMSYKGLFSGEQFIEHKVCFDFL